MVNSRFNPVTSSNRNWGREDNLNSIMYGENYATLMRSGAGRFIQGPELSTRLVDLASSNISIDKQLETLYTANDQIYLRQQIENFKKVPKTLF